MIEKLKEIEHSLELKEVETTSLSDRFYYALLGTHDHISFQCLVPYLLLFFLLDLYKHLSLTKLKLKTLKVSLPPLITEQSLLNYQALQLKRGDKNVLPFEKIPEILKLESRFTQLCMLGKCTDSK